MNKLTLLASASILAIGMATQAAAQPTQQSTLEDLCDTTVSVDTAVKGTVEFFTPDSTCSIQLADGASLEIKDADITIDEDNLKIVGLGTVDIRNTWLMAQQVLLDVPVGDIIIKDSHLDIEQSTISSNIFEIKSGTGNIDLRNNDFVSQSQEDLRFANIEIYATTGDIAVVDIHFDVGRNLDIISMNGDVEVTGNTGIVGLSLLIKGGDVTVKGNDIDVTASVEVDVDDAAEVKDNDFRPADSAIQGSPTSCDVKDNMPAFNTTACP